MPVPSHQIPETIRQIPTGLSCRLHPTYHLPCIIYQMPHEIGRITNPRYHLPDTCAHMRYKAWARQRGTWCCSCSGIDATTHVICLQPSPNMEKPVDLSQSARGHARLNTTAGNHLRRVPCKFLRKPMNTHASNSGATHGKTHQNRECP